MMLLAASADWLSSRSSAFDAIVFTSRFSSWIRKSSARPTEPPLSRSKTSCSRCARSRVNSSRTSVLSAQIATSVRIRPSSRTTSPSSAPMRSRRRSWYRASAAGVRAAITSTWVRRAACCACSSAPSASPSAARHELVEGAAQYVREDRPRDPARRRLGVLRANDARTLEHPRERHVFAEARGASERPRLLDVLGGERGIDSDLLGRLAWRRAELNGDVDPPTLETRLDQPASVHLERAERAWQPQRDVEVAMVDGARFDGHGRGGPASLGPAESRHAAKGRNRGEPGGWHPAIIGRNLL